MLRQMMLPEFMRSGSSESIEESKSDKVLRGIRGLFKETREKSGDRTSTRDAGKVNTVNTHPPPPLSPLITVENNETHEDNQIPPQVDQDRIARLYRDLRMTREKNSDSAPSTISQTSRVTELKTNIHRVENTVSKLEEKISKLTNLMENINQRHDQTVSTTVVKPYKSTEKTCNIKMPVLSPDLSEPDQRSFRKIKDFKTVFNTSYTKGGSMSIVQFLNILTANLNSVGVCFTPKEYRLCLLSFFSGEDRIRIESMITDMDTIDIETLHSTIVTVLSESTNINLAKRSFYNYLPNPESCSLEKICSDLASKGLQANVSQQEISSKLISLLPQEFKAEIRASEQLMSKLNIQGDPPTPLEILTLFSDRLSLINNSLKRMYRARTYPTEKVNQTIQQGHNKNSNYNQEKGNNKNNRKVNQIKETSRETGKRPVITCPICLRLGHGEETCFKRDNITCYLCGDKHLSAKCAKYKNISPLFLPCTHCASKGNRLYHPTNICKEQVTSGERNSKNEVSQG